MSYGVYLLSFYLKTKTVNYCYDILGGGEWEAAAVLQMNGGQGREDQL